MWWGQRSIRCLLCLPRVVLSSSTLFYECHPFVSIQANPHYIVLGFLLIGTSVFRAHMFQFHHPICFQLPSSLGFSHPSRLYQCIHRPSIISLYSAYVSDSVVLLPVTSSPDALFSVSVSAGVLYPYMHDDTTTQSFKTLSIVSSAFCST